MKDGMWRQKDREGGLTGNYVSNAPVISEI